MAATCRLTGIFSVRHSLTLRSLVRRADSPEKPVNCPSRKVEPALLSLIIGIYPAAKKPTVWGSAPAMICTGRLIQPEDPLYTSRSAMVERLPVNRIELLQGTLDLMILQTLRWGPQHGHGIGQAIRVSSQDAIQVEHGSLYPALHRLERRGWLAAEWKISEANRRA